MKKGKKILTVLVTGIFVLGITMTAFASDVKNYSYSVGTTYVAKYSITLNRAGTMALNTRPTVGQSGVQLWVAGSNGSSYYQGFPYYQSIPDWTVGLSSGVTYTTHIRSYAGTAEGTLRRTLY